MEWLHLIQRHVFVFIMLSFKNRLLWFMVIGESRYLSKK